MSEIGLYVCEDYVWVGSCGRSMGVYACHVHITHTYAHTSAHTQMTP